MGVIRSRFPSAPLPREEIELDSSKTAARGVEQVLETFGGATKKLRTNVKKIEGTEEGAVRITPKGGKPSSENLLDMLMAQPFQKGKAKAAAKAPSRAQGSSAASESSTKLPGGGGGSRDGDARTKRQAQINQSEQVLLRCRQSVQMLEDKRSCSSVTLKSVPGARHFPRGFAGGRAREGSAQLSFLAGAGICDPGGEDH